MPSPPLCNRTLTDCSLFSFSGCQAHSAVFSQVLGPFQASAFHPFIEPVVKILKSIKLICISWEKKGGTKIYSHCFVEEAIAFFVFSHGINDKDDEKIIKRNGKTSPMDKTFLRRINSLPDKFLIR